MYNTRYSCKAVMKLKFSPQRFEKYSNAKCHEIPAGCGAELFRADSGGTDRRTDRQTDMAKLVVVFRGSIL